MPFTRSADPAPEPGLLADLFAADRRYWGYLPHSATTLGVRPAVYAAWRQLNGAIKAGMPARRYKVATLAAAVELRSSYCSLAHGKVLAAEHLTEDQVVAIAAGDLEPLRAAGLGDDEIFDVILATAARCFFSTALDASGTQADAAFNDLPDRLRDALTVGRPRAMASR